MSLVNLAEWASGVTSLGPGSRSVVWVQGCSRRCPGCWSPEWQSFEVANLIEATALAALLARNTGDSGLTVSGGEPMFQAAGILAMWHSLKRLRPDWTLLLFSGYYHEEILMERHPVRMELLQTADAYIGGPYVEALNDGKGLCGSSNKEVYLPPASRFTVHQQALMRQAPRTVEWRRRTGALLQIGLPEKGISTGSESKASIATCNPQSKSSSQNNGCNS